MNLRFPILVLAAVALLPVLVFSGVIIARLDGLQRQQVDATLRQSARAAIHSVDRRLSDHLTTLRALAAAPSLDRGDLAEFETHAARVIKTEPQWLAIRLTGESERRIVVDLYPPGGNPGPAGGLDPASLDTVLGSGAPAIGGVRRSPEYDEPLVVLRVPVRRGGAVRYALTAAIRVSAFSRILLDQAVSEDWTLAVLDHGLLIAGRNRQEQAFIGTRATPTLTDAIAKANENFFFSLNKEGDRVYTAFSRSAFSGWTVAVGAPADAVEGPARRALLTSLAGGAAALLLAFLLVASLVRNIARRQAAERELNAERRLGDIAANFPGVIYRRVLHRDGTVSYPYVSEGVAELVGETPGGHSALTLDDMARLITAPEDAGPWKDVVLHSARKLEPYRIEGRLRRVDGTLRWVRSAANPHREADGSIVWDGVVLDITDQKEAEAALRRSEAMTRAIVEAAADGIVTVDETGCVEGFNPAAQRLFGHAAPAVIGRDVRILLPERYHDRYGEWSHALPDDDGIVLAGRTIEAEGLRKDATTFPAEISVGLALVDGRRLFAGVVRDVTERKRAEDDLRRTLAEREVLLQEVHHRVKNNLQVIVAMISLEVRRLESPEARTRVAEISQRVLAMGRVHERLYASGDLARIDFGQYLDDLARGIAELYSGLPVTLEVDVADRWWCDLDCAIPLGLIANELVVNAFKHAFPDGGAGHVRVGLRRIGEASVEVSVADDGNGGVAEAGAGGIGTTLVRTLARQIEATLRIEREAGMRVAITVPVPSVNA